MWSVRVRSGLGAKYAPPPLWPQLATPVDKISHPCFNICKEAPADFDFDAKVVQMVERLISANEKDMSK